MQRPIQSINRNSAERGMGIGALATGSNRFKKKYQWTFDVILNCSDTPISEQYVKIASRPNITVDEIEINFLNEKMFIPGKATWETINVTYYDMASQGIEPLYHWIASVYEFNNPTRFQGTTVSDYTGDGFLREYDGGGNNVATWKLGNAWPTQVNFGEVDYQNSEEMTIELTLRYTNVEYRSFCPDFIPSGCFTPCGTGTGTGTGTGAGAGAGIGTGGFVGDINTAGASGLV